jgi:DNA-binding winged helix-turn-helix (wHTH) protein
MQLQPIVPAEKSDPMHRSGSGMAGRQAGPSEADTTLEFGRFRLLTRRRQLLADGAPVELGTRAIDLLMVLIEADGALVTKGELLARVWPRTFVDATNLKVQVCELRKALVEDRDFIRTEFGRGYRFIGSVRALEELSANPRPMRRGHRSRRDVCRKRTFRRSQRTRRAARSNWPRRATCSPRIG